MYREVMEVTERVLGKEHPFTLTSMNNLATVLSDQRQYEKAAEIQVVVVVGFLRIFGSEHPNSRGCMNTLLTIWKFQGMEENAVEQALLQVFEKSCEQNYPAASRA